MAGAPWAFWTRRYFTVAAGAFVVIAAAGTLRGRPFARVLLDSLVWSLITAGIFVAARRYRVARGQPCEVCQDMPDRNQT